MPGTDQTYMPDVRENIHDPVANGVIDNPMKHHAMSNGYTNNNHCDPYSNGHAVADNQNEVIREEVWVKNNAMDGVYTLQLVPSKELDELAPAQSYTTFKADEAVKLHMTESGFGSEKPRTIPSQLKDTVERVGHKIAMAVQRDGGWIHWTYQQYHKDIIRVAKAFIKVGLQPFHAVGILGFNSPEWFLSDMGAIHAGGIAVGLYTTSTPSAIEFIVEDARCNIIVVENDMQLQKVLAIKDNLQHLKAIIQYTGTVSPECKDVISWDTFMMMGRDIPDSILEKRLRMIAPNKCSTLIYTSGTTGKPKGVMISHDNILWTALEASRTMEVISYGNEIGISYLPLSHVAAQLLDIYIPITTGSAVYFAQPDALKGSLVETLKDVRPTVFFGVPRVWEKIQEKMLAIGRQNTGLKKKIGAWAKSVGLKGSYAKMNGQSPGFSFTLANALVFKKIKAALGLDRCHIFMSGAAPIMKSTLDYFMSLNIPIFEVYGMSESSGPQTINHPSQYLIGSIGPAFKGATTKLVDQDDKGNGEICMFGRHVMMGYLNQETKTRDTIDADGYLHSEDIGRIDQNGFLYITGRIKELIITAGGENIAPVPIEDAVKDTMPFISNCMLIGDKRKFLSLLICLKTEVDLDTGEPKDKFGPDMLRFCEEIGAKSTTVSELLKTKESCIYTAITNGITTANKQAVSNAARISEWRILPRDFSIPGGELGPTLKVRRQIVTDMYSEVISQIYEESAVPKT